MTEHKTDMNITKYKKLNMTEHKIDMTITKIDKYKKLNNNSMMEHKTDIPNTKTDHDRTHYHLSLIIRNRSLKKLLNKIGPNMEP